ncbi:MAG: type I pullulanase, partial [Helcococcus sp.]|nr:type I pullulanase [Helcococcus sp.]
WSIWLWPEGGNGAQYEFTSTDDFGQVAEIVLDGKYDKAGIIIKGTDDWSKNVDGDRYVELTEEVTHVWLRDKDEKVYLEKPLRLDQEPLTITDFSIDSFTEANVKVNKNISLEDFIEDYNLTVNGESIKDKVESMTVVNGTDEETKQIKITFKENLNLEDTIHLKVNLFNGEENVALEADSRIGKVISDPKFDELFYYDGTLGAIYSKGETEFKLWAPTSKQVNLLIFENGEVVKTIPMTRGDKGVYTYKLSGDQLGTEYMYEVHVNGKVNRAVDPYAKAVTVNGERGVVANPKPTDVPRPVGKDMKNPIIYELHIRDYSIAENSGMKNKGKFLALTEKGTKADNGQMTGIDYLESLGVTHIQILPMYDYASVNEASDKPQFNWGYDPLNYNAVEGSYSKDATKPFLRIEELQDTIDAIHNKGMGVIMDVVYNHVFDPARHSFEYVVPGYYFRQDDKGGFLGGTGVGNETASERKMMRKFIIDSTKYWVETYKLDGLRFDLMGTHDYETMNMVYEELVKINPNIFILGEGWNMDMGISEDLRATQKNAAKMPKLSFFSDDIRDGVKGNVFTATDPGFVNGKSGQESYIMQNIKGGQGLQGYVSASQVVQYVEAHDNLTLWDKLEITNPDDTEETRLKMHKLATSIVMLAQGTPFIHAGQEWARTKGGDHNSYKSPDSVNQFDWDRVLEYKDNIDYFRELIKIRKAYDVFNLKEYSQINKVFKEISKSNDLVSYKLENGDKDLYIAHNASRESREFEVENGIYKVLVRNQKANSLGLEELQVQEGVVEVAPLSTLVLVQKVEEETE